MIATYPIHRVLRITLPLFALVMICSPSWAKEFLSFKINPEYLASYPTDWYRPDTSSNKFVVSPTAERDSNDPPIIQIRAYDLSTAEAALADSEFIEYQLKNHIIYLEDNLNFDYEISPPVKTKTSGANQAFCIHTVFNEEDSAISETNYARKGNRMFIFRFWCPSALYEKYLTDYYVMLGSFSLK